MARPFTYISSQMYYDLELYYFRLAMYTDSDEYEDLSVENRNKIDKEIMFLDNILTTMQMFRQIDKSERPVVVWKEYDENERTRFFRFSSITVAAKCLSLNPSKISAVCRKEKGRKTTKGFRCMYEEEWEHPYTVRKYKPGNRKKVKINHYEDLIK